MFSKHSFKPILILAIFSATPSAFPGVEEEAEKAYRAGNYKRALELALPEARLGEHQAQLIMGDLYASGLGVTQSYPEAKNWYQKAASSSNNKAQFQLGQLYYYGRGTTKDLIEAYKWYVLAKNGGGDTAIVADVNLRGIQKKLTPPQIQEANKRVKDFYKSRQEAQNKKANPCQEDLNWGYKKLDGPLPEPQLTKFKKDLYEEPITLVVYPGLLDVITRSGDAVGPAEEKKKLVKIASLLGIKIVSAHPCSGTYLFRVPLGREDEITEKLWHHPFIKSVSRPIPMVAK